MKMATITEDGKFVIPPHIQSQTGLTPGVSVEFEADGSVLMVRLPRKKLATKPIWEYAGMFKIDKTMTIEEMDKATMEAAADHCSGIE
jgi:bifunctional DNA-binding transcriptional regulator/antitoxin component of YhaV-PrlF toxin-antitoxin module